MNGLFRNAIHHHQPLNLLALPTFSRRSLRTSAVMSSASTAAALYAAVTTIPSPEPTPEDAKDLSHHVQGGKSFRNPWPSWYEWSTPGIIKTMSSRKLSGKGKTPDTTPPTVPVRTPTFLTARENDTLRATWLGHACYLVEFPGGLRVLFDPVFTQRCSPFSFLGPKRYTPAPCQIEDIPIIDAVVISHSHYDHLSHPTILKIKELHPRAHFFAGLGLKKWFNDAGIENVTEMDWWESKNITLSSKPTSDGSEKKVTVEPAHNASASTAGEVRATIGCLPCQHMSARTLFDRSVTLWASWSVTSGGSKVWFAGDTGYRSVPELPDGEDDYDSKYDFPHCPAFKSIGDLRGPFDLGLIPIGAYDPRYIMSPMHANPFDSVNIFKDSKCKKALGMHWGTWVLTEEDVLEPPKLLKKALDRNGFKDHSIFDVCDIGESRTFPN